MLRMLGSVRNRAKLRQASEYVGHNGHPKTMTLAEKLDPAIAQYNDLKTKPTTPYNFEERV